jgi:hypothetical protein
MIDFVATWVAIAFIATTAAVLVNRTSPERVQIMIVPIQKSDKGI